MTILTVLALFCCAALGGACLYLRRELADLRRRAATLQADIAEFAAEPADVPTSEVASTRDRRLITVEILNPLEVAAEQSKVGGTISRVAPATVTRIVYDQTAKQILAELNEEGVEADVRVRGA